LKTNTSISPSTSATLSTPTNPKSIFHHTKEHCLMGIKGTVTRNQDGHIVHANIDTDVIISEEPPFGSMYFFVF
jgi:hypothetical protein